MFLSKFAKLKQKNKVLFNKAMKSQVLQGSEVPEEGSATDKEEAARSDFQETGPSGGEIRPPVLKKI